MKILLWHGYLMSGSGSNVYTANVTAAWRRQGHDVLVMCQQSDPARFAIVDEEGSFAADNRSYELRATDRDDARRGRCSVVRPAIGDVLPVYVYDEYEGFTAKLFVDLTDEELAAYTEANVTAMETALDRFSPDAVITGHEVMGPYIALCACERTRHAYLAKLHGSALEYAVKLQERYVGYAAQGLGAARCVVGGSTYMIEEAARAIPGWRDKARVVNPGVDVDLFAPRTSRAPGPPTVAFVGKLIAEKGVHHLLAALGLTRTESLRAVIVGYGGDESEIKELDAAFSRGDRSAAVRAAERLALADDLREFLASAPVDYYRRRSTVEVEFTGRLEHDALAPVLPTFDVLVVPSIVAEAFGMVAAEAAASGVLPLVPDHSGISEAGEAIETHLGMSGFLTYDASDPIAGIAAGIDRILEIAPAERAEMGRAASELALERWSWGHVAERLLDLAVHGPGASTDEAHQNQR